MARLHPVRLRLVAPAHAAEVVGPPEGLLEEAARRALAAERPLSFLNATPDPGGHPEESPERLRRAAAAYLEDRIDEGAFGPPREGVFVYRIATGDHVQTAVVADVHVDDYPGLVRPHERTIADREEELAAYLTDVGMTSNPVGITHRPSGALRTAVRLVADGEPELTIEIDRERHVVWEVPGRLLPGISAAFDDLEATYVLDGHHRMAAARSHARRVGATRADPAGRVLVAAAPGDELVVRPFHRWIDATWPADGGHWGKGTPPDPRPGEAVAVTSSGWRVLDLGPAPGELDVMALERVVLAPMLGVTDTRHDDRFEAVPGTEEAMTVCERVDVLGGVGLLLHPPGIEDLFALSDRGDVMPPKSTFFAPKPRSGIFLTDRRHPPRHWGP